MHGTRMIHESVYRVCVRYKYWCLIWTHKLYLLPYLGNLFYTSMQVLKLLREAYDRVKELLKKVSVVYGILGWIACLVLLTYIVCNIMETPAWESCLINISWINHWWPPSHFFAKMSNSNHSFFDKSHELLGCAGCIPVLPGYMGNF